MKQKKNLIIILIGIGVLVYGYLEYNKYQQEQNKYNKIQATVDSVQINNSNRILTFIFDVNGTTYTSNITTDENLEIGNTRDIYYDKKSPNNTKLELITIYKSIIILSTGGLIFLLGIIISMKQLLVKGRIKKLKKKGILINAMIQEVLVVPKDKGKNPYKIRAQYLNPQDNKTYFYESEEVKTDLKDIVSKKNIKTIPVYLNPKNTSDYYVDLEVIR